jgi:hypothetical protein
VRIFYLTATLFTAAVVLISAIAKLKRDPHVVEVIHETVGVPLRYLPALAACEVLGALGLIGGIWWPPIGITAGMGLVLYFVGAVVAHIRVGDFAGIGPAAFVLGLSVAALMTRIATP